MSISTPIRMVLGAVVALSLLSACGGDTPPGTSTGGDGASADAGAAAVAAYADMVHAGYSASLEGARKLQAACSALVAEPSEARLEAARAAWVAAREPYGPTEVFRFYGGPIDGDDGPEGLMNAWPIDEVYVDYVEGKPDGGVINHADTTIDEATLLALHEKDAETNVATGYHVIEFLLWGQDLSADGPGARPHTDYVVGDGGHPHAERRGQYLQLACSMLIGHLESLVEAWKPGAAGNYRAAFVADTDQALARIFTGMHMLSSDELSGERINVALESRDQENEQSCFSDNTLADHLGNAKGISDVFTIVEPVLAARDADLAAKLKAANGEVSAAIAAIPAPFDRALGDEAGRRSIQAALEALDAQAELLEAAMKALELSSQVPPEPAEGEAK